MSRIDLWLACGLIALNGGALADEMSSTGLRPEADLPVDMLLQQTGADVSGRLYLVAGLEREHLPAEIKREAEPLRMRLRELWKPPPGEAQVVYIVMKLKRDRTLAGPPTVFTKGEGALFGAARDSAIAAIYRGQPYTMLRPEHYHQWKEIGVRFDSHYLPSQ
jgi:hypothetical protein